jgi:hypothetical protein
MILKEEPRQATTDIPEAHGVSAEALIKEARQRQRRRWLSIAVATIVVVVASGIAVHLASPARKPPVQSTTGTRQSGADTTAYPTCGPDQLALSSRFYNVDISGSYDIYSVTNKGAAPCRLNGAPRFAVQNAAGKAVETISGSVPRGEGKSVNLPPGRRGSFAAWWDSCPNSLPSSEVRTEAVTVSWTFAGQKSGIAQHIPKFTVGCPDVSFTVSAIEPGVMTHPPWLQAPSAQPQRLGTTYVFGP